jgi:hypothetical protein
MLISWLFLASSSVAKPLGRHKKAGGNQFFPRWKKERLNDAKAHRNEKAATEGRSLRRQE